VFLLILTYFISQSGQLDLKHFDPEFVREPVPGLFLLPCFNIVVNLVR